jgi:phosphatidylglycerophosphatase A
LNSKEIQLVGVYRQPAVWIATAGGFGYAPVAPGTVGSLAGVLVFVALALPGVRLPAAFALHAAAVVAISLLGVWAAGRCESVFGRADDGRIVIDEVAGQLLTLTPVLSVAILSPAGISWLVTGFVAFRVLDIWKPGPVRWAERRFQGGLGVMADDWMAGGIGALLLAGLMAVSP